MNLKASLLDYSVGPGIDRDASSSKGASSAAPGLDSAAAAVSDEALLRRSAAGDEIAFAGLYERYGVSVYNYILRLLHDKAVAENLVQDTFVAVWEGAAGFGGRAKARTWIFRIAHHRAVDWMRREGKRDAVEEAGSSPLSLEESSTIEGPEKAVLRASDVTKVKRALDQLSPAHRAVVELTFYAGLPYQEIAEVLDCPVGTVKSRMSWARKYLAKALDES